MADLEIKHIDPILTPARRTLIMKYRAIILNPYLFSQGFGNMGLLESLNLWFHNYR
jgi:hypothetical protein